MATKLKVKCIDNTGIAFEFLKFGQVYEAEDRGNEFYYIFLTHERGIEGWYKDRFKLVPEPEAPEAPPAKIVSDGGSTEYYKLPQGASELGDLIEYKNMNFNQGNIFKAAYRLGEKDGNTVEYDLRKIIFFAQRELNRVTKGTANV